MKRYCRRGERGEKEVLETEIFYTPKKLHKHLNKEGEKSQQRRLRRRHIHLNLFFS